MVVDPYALHHDDPAEMRAHRFMEAVCDKIAMTPALRDAIERDIVRMLLVYEALDEAVAV